MSDEFRIDLQLFASGAITTDDVDPQALLKEFQEGISIYNEQELNALVQLLTYPTTKDKAKVPQQGLSFKPAAEGVNADKMKAALREVGFDFNDYDLGLLFTIQGFQDMTQEELDENLSQVLQADRMLLAFLIFQRMLVPHSTVGALTGGFWNGELDVPDFRMNKFAGTAHTHYLISGATTIALDDLSEAKRHIRHHGYGMAPNSLHMFINSQQVKEAEDLTGWSDANKTALQVGGLNALGQIDEWIVHPEDWVPTGYLVGVSTDVKPIGLRKHTKPQYQGLQIFAPNEGTAYPLKDAQYMRRVGTGVAHRGAGIVMQLAATGSYTAPTMSL